MLFVEDLKSALITFMPFLDKVSIVYVVRVFDWSKVTNPKKIMKLTCCYLIVKHQFFNN